MSDTVKVIAAVATTFIVAGIIYQVVKNPAVAQGAFRTTTSLGQLLYSK